MVDRLFGPEAIDNLMLGDEQVTQLTLGRVRVWPASAEIKASASLNAVSAATAFARRRASVAAALASASTIAGQPARRRAAAATLAAVSAGAVNARVHRSAAATLAAVSAGAVNARVHRSAAATLAAVSAGAADATVTPAGPDTIADLEVWLDADDAATITDAGGGAVSAWLSKDPTGRIFAQATGGARPTTGAVTQNGKNVLAFGGNDFLTSSEAAAAWNYLHNGAESTVVTVFSHASAGVNYDLLGTTRTSSQHGYYIEIEDSAGNNIVRHDIYRGVSGGANVTVRNTSGAGFHTGGMACLTIVSDPDNGTAAARSSMFFNAGSAVANNAVTNAPSATNAQHPLNIGSGSGTTGFLTGNIAEVIIYSRALSAGERGVLLAYLTAKWGL